VATAVFVPMWVKHLWTSIYSRLGKYPSGAAARLVALYEAGFYIWALTLSTPMAPIIALMAAIHLIGVPLYFMGTLSKYSRYGRYYSAFEAAELAVITALYASLILS